MRHLMTKSIKPTVLIAALSLLAVMPGWAGSPPLATVPQVDVARYAGQWYEIARLPMPHQDHCVSDTTATYALKDNGAIKVTNRCRQADGSWSQAEGLARSLDASNSRLSVTFLPKLLRWLPLGRGDYWIMALDADYQHVLIGQPSRQYLWLLSRQPVLDESTVGHYLQLARNQGYDLAKLIRTPHASTTD